MQGAAAFVQFIGKELVVHTTNGSYTGVVKKTNADADIVELDSGGSWLMVALSQVVAVEPKKASSSY